MQTTKLGIDVNTVAPRVGRPTPRIHELDALRGLAALSVVLFHCTMGQKIARYGFYLGVMGVNLFFIISGFVILMTLERTRNWKDFVVSRFSRLYPAYWVAATFTLLLILVSNLLHHRPNEGLGIRFIANLTMLQQFLGQANLDGPYWTLTVELTFYALMLFIYSQGLIPKIEQIGAVLLFCSCAFGFLSLRQMAVVNQWAPLVRHFPLFFAGIVFYRVRFDGWSLFRVTLLACCLFLQIFTFLPGGARNLFIGPISVSVTETLFMVLFGLFASRRLGWIVNPFTLYLGGISYSLYLVHQYLSISIVIPIAMQFLHVPLISAVFIAVVTSISFATLLNRYVEMPAMKIIRAKWKNAHSEPTTPADPHKLVDPI